MFEVCTLNNKSEIIDSSIVHIIIVIIMIVDKKRLAKH